MYHTSSTIFRLLFVKLRIEISDLSKMTSYRAKENEAVLLLSHLLIVVGLFIICSCKKMGEKATGLGVNFPIVQGIDGRTEAKNVR